MLAISTFTMLHLTFQLTGAPIIEFAYYLTLSIAIPFLSASIAVGATIFDIDDSPIGDLRGRSLPRWVEYASGIFGITFIMYQGYNAFWYIGAMQVAMLTLRRFEARLNHNEARTAAQTEAAMLQMQHQ